MAQRHSILVGDGRRGGAYRAIFFLVFFVKILTSIDDSNILIERSKTIDPRNERMGVRRYFLHVETSETDQ